MQVFLAEVVKGETDLAVAAGMFPVCTLLDQGYKNHFPFAPILQN